MFVIKYNCRINTLFLSCPFNLRYFSRKSPKSPDRRGPARGHDGGPARLPGPCPGTLPDRRGPTRGPAGGPARPPRPSPGTGREPCPTTTAASTDRDYRRSWRGDIGGYDSPFFRTPSGIPLRGRNRKTVGFLTNVDRAEHGSH